MNIARLLDRAARSYGGLPAVAVGTALFVDPRAPEQILDGLRDYLNRRGLTSVRDLIGQMK